jgi:hypothetical protein
VPAVCDSRVKLLVLCRGVFPDELMHLERLDSKKIDMDCYKDVVNDSLPDAAPYMSRVSFPSGECLFELHSL